MVGAALRPESMRSRRELVLSGSRLGVIEELEGLRKALTAEEFESVKRHLLAG